MPTITVTPNTNIVLVNTASGDQTTVNLPPVTPGQLITIRDNVGAASSSNFITITTTGGSAFSTGTVLPDGNSNIKISQPFGAVTVGYSGGYKWNILNTFAFENPTFASVDAVTVQSVTFRDLGGSGDNYLLNVTNDMLYKDGIKIIEAPEFNLGIARHNGGISSLSSIVSYGLSSIVSAGGGTPSNWAAYPAISNVNMSNYSILNLSNIEVNGAVGSPSKSVLVVGDSVYLRTIVNDVQQGDALNIGSIIKSIYYNGSLWIAGGNTNGYIYYSTNGSNWTLNTTKTFQTGIIEDIIYADNTWVAVGDTGLSYSSNGFNWIKNTNLLNTNLRCVGYDGSRWVIGGNIENGWTLATLNNITLDFTPVTSGGFTSNANRILYANNIWVALGSDNNNGEIQYSINRINWFKASNISIPGGAFFSLSQTGVSLAYGNGYWLAGGDKYIYRSVDGSNFSKIYTLPNDTSPGPIKYEGGSVFYSSYNNYNSSEGTLVKSIDNGSTWSNVLNNNINIILSMGISYTSAVIPTDNTLIGGGALTTTNINASNITVGGTLTVGGLQITGGDSVSNWATYPATSNLDMSNFSITNVSNLTLSGTITFPDGTLSITDGNEIKVNDAIFSAITSNPTFTSITFGDNISIDTSFISDSQKYLTLNGVTYINGKLTLSDALILSDSNIIGPTDTTLTYNGNPIGGGGGGDASTWSQNNATQNVNIGGYNIIDVNSLEFGTSPNVMSLTKSVDNAGNDYILVDGTIKFNDILVDGTIKFNDQLAPDAIDFGDRPVTNVGNLTINGDVLITSATTPNGLDITGTLIVSSNTSLADTTINGTLTLNGHTFTTLANPVGAYIEIHNSNTGSYTTYPLYITTENAENPIDITPTNGWWTAQGGTPRFKGIILLPNYTISYTATSNQEDSIIVNNVNIIPTHIVLSNDETNELDYRASLYYYLTYNPT